ncbi:MAG TPA: glycosyltransferase family 87 protein [Candidatus Dormibacteraeota bacterium]|nr:glycosyltransferase family 87 protein [Candidatus Dormibacteraeota bacterium]
MSYAQSRGENLIRRINVARAELWDRGMVAAAFVVVVWALFLDVAIRNDPISVDFHTYLAAADVGLRQGWSHIYDQGLISWYQMQLAPGARLQPFLSPPTVALAVAPLMAFPYDTAYVIWAAVGFGAFAVALALCGVSRGLGRWVAVVGALAPWWVMHAVNVGQVVPLVAAGTVVAWRLLRDRRDVLAGIALGAILLKPNTAMLVPVALLFAGRFRALAAWAGTAAVVFAAIAALLGPSGVSTYLDQMRGPWPTGADNATLHGAFAVTGILATALRALIVGAAMAAVFRFRETPSLVLPVAIMASLLVSPYLHGSDLCLLAAAGWMIWEDRPSVAWRALLAAAWFLASPFLYLQGESPHLQQWPWLEFAIFAALLLTAFAPLTTWADSRRRAPA